MPVSPDLAEGLARATVNIYIDAELALLELLARRLGAGLQRPTWAQERLLLLQQVRAQAERVVAGLQQPAAQLATTAVATAYARGAAGALSDLARLRVATTALIPSGDAVNRLALQTVENLTAPHQAILRVITDAYRAVVAEVAGRTLASLATRRQAAQAALNRFAARGITGFTDRAGRRWDLASYAEMAMRTATGRAAVEGGLDRLSAAGLDLVIVSDAPQECRLCVVPGTVVEGPVPEWRCRLEYAGDLISVRTAIGKHLTGTPDHTVLTVGGWRRLKELHPGDQVISDSGQQGIARVVPDHVQVPTPIEQVGETVAPLLLAGPTRRQLDGNVAYREVQIVGPNGLLLDARDAAPAEPFGDLSLVGGIGLGAQGLGGGDPDFDLVGAVLASAGFMGGLDHLASLVGRSFPPALEHALGREGGALLMGQAGHVVGHSEMPRSGLNSGATQVVGDSPAADAEGGAELLRALAGHVTPDEVISLGVRQFAGHVWDLQTGPSWYSSNGIISHNCRPWEGKILARTGPAGTITAKHLLTGQPTRVHVAGTIAGARAAGLQHPNCRHSLSAYLPGVTRLPIGTEDPEGDQDRQYLRYLERGVRMWKRRAAVALDEDTRRQASARARGWQARIREHVAGTSAKRQPPRERIGVAR